MTCVVLTFGRIKKEGGDITSFHPFNMFPSYHYIMENRFFLQMPGKDLIFNVLKYLLIF